MAELETALAQLREALEGMLADARAETVALSGHDVAKVQALTLRRQEFNGLAAARLAEVRRGLTGGARTAAVTQAIAELHTLAEALRAQDGLNLQLAGQALRFTRAYLDALLPRPRAYDRRGLATPLAPALNTLSQHF